MRQYEPLWLEIKKLLDKSPEERAKGVSVIANRLHHSRIVKAVVKEKYNDIWFKLKIEPRVALLSHTRSQSKLSFFIKLTDSSLTHQDF